jgi:hypothetical protein
VPEQETVSVRESKEAAASHDEKALRDKPCIVRLFMQITRLITKTTVCHFSFAERTTKRIGISAQQTGYTQECSSTHPTLTHNATSSTRLTSLTWVPARSSSTGIKSRSSLSCASENQLLIGTACCGWKMYDVGELSMMMVSFR